MRFAPTTEQREFAASLRTLIERADVPSALRARAAGDSASVRGLWRQLADAGVTALGTAEKHGGFGADTVDLVIGFTELGRGAVPGPWVESVAVLPALLAGTPAEEELPAMAAGERVASLAAPPHVPYAVDADLADIAYLLDGGALSAGTAGELRRSVDPSRSLVEVRPGDVVADTDAELALDLGALATAAYVRGCGVALLDRAVDYAKARTQFGRAIGSFQAVKHQLADALVALDLAEPLLLGAALSVRSDDAARTRDVSAAKVACTDAAYLASRVALQVHGAIGYTAEYDLALWLVKVRALVSAWGTQQVHRDRVLATLR
jgi:alkylation response protein AidB-like acyl-CoA dehydrogenase